MKIDRRQLLQAGAASLATLATSKIHPAKALLVPQAVWFNGSVVLNQYGPTPDVVQGAIAFDVNGSPLQPVISGSSFTFTAALRIPPRAFETTHTDSGMSAPLQYMSVMQSQFTDQPFIGAHWLYLMDDGAGGVNLRVTLLSDEYGTDFMTIYADSIFAQDDDWHKFQFFANTQEGTADYAVDGIPSSAPLIIPDRPRPIPPRCDVGGWTGPFDLPVTGMQWQIGADTLEENPASQWMTTYVGGMAEVGLAHGQGETIIPTTLSILDRFVALRDGRFLYARRLIPWGLPILGSAPTIYLTGAAPGADVGPDFLDGDVAWFESVLGVGNSPIQPWVQGATHPDLDNNANIVGANGLLAIASSDPY